MSYPAIELGSCRTWKVDRRQKCFRCKPKLGKIIHMLKRMLLLAPFCFSFPVCKIQLLSETSRITWDVELKLQLFLVAKHLQENFVFFKCIFYLQLFKSNESNRSHFCKQFLDCRFASEMFFLSFWTYRRGKFRQISI